MLNSGTNLAYLVMYWVLSVFRHVLPNASSLECRLTNPTNDWQWDFRAWIHLSDRLVCDHDSHDRRGIKWLWELWRIFPKLWNEFPLLNWLLLTTNYTVHCNTKRPFREAILYASMSTYFRVSTELFYWIHVASVYAFVNAVRKYLYVRAFIITAL